jgi:hypothetical protein
VTTPFGLRVVHEPDFRNLVEAGRRARISDRIAGDPVQWFTPVTKRQFTKIAAVAGSLDPEHTAKGRIEQNYLRNKRQCAKGQAERPSALLFWTGWVAGEQFMGPAALWIRSHLSDAPH